MTDLAVSAAPPRVQYLADGAQTVFPFPFPVLEPGDLRVWFDAVPAGIPFAAEGLRQGAGGSLRFASPPPSGTRVTITRAMAIRRESDFVAGAELRAAALNEELDRLVLQLQQVDDKASRALRLDDSDLGGDTQLPAGSARANRVLGFDAAGKPALLGSDTIPQGPPGPQGAMGAAGPAGPQGVQGPPGPQGVAGPKGPDGSPGPAGPQGPQGLQGVPGPQGPAGVSGPEGAAGQSFTPDQVGLLAERADFNAQPKGFAYLAADVGQLYFKLSNASGDWSAGIFFGRGDAGAQGPQGAIGPVGPVGPQGPQGIQGLQGLSGPKGLRWLGAWNAATAYAIDDAVSFSGASYIANQASTNVAPGSNAAIWQLIAAKGDAGPQGPMGATGSQGPAGPQGLTGPAGPQGATGPQGAPGAGLPNSGSAGQVLAKTSNTDFAVAWQSLGSFVAKSGDTMSGELAAPSLKSGGATVLASGFKLGDGSDLGDRLLHTARSITQADNPVANCAGLIANGNCLGNPLWAMPNANWWTWGVGVTRGNPQGYDFAGGMQTVDQPVPQVNAGIAGGYYLHQAEVGFDAQRRDVQNCNCGPANCFSNCNCNCNCACDCACVCTM